jgi:hypothetical protein
MAVINRLLGLLVGLALLAAGLILIAETALAAMGRAGWLVDRDALGDAAGQLQWADHTVVGVAAIVAVASLALALLQLWPARARPVAMSPHGADRRDAIAGKGLERLLRRAAAEDDDVVGADVAVRRRKAKVKVRVPADADARAVRMRVARRVQDRLDALGLERPISPRVKTQRSKERVR